MPIGTPGGSGGGSSAAGAVTLTGADVEVLYEDSSDYTYTGSTGGTGSDVRTITLSRSLVTADVGKILRILTNDETTSTVRTKAGAPASVTNMQEQHEILITDGLIAGTDIKFLESYNLSTGDVGWAGARVRMPAANQLAFSLRLNRASPTVRQIVELHPLAEHLDVEGGGLVDTAGIGSLDELDEQPALGDFLGIVDDSADAAKKVTIENMGVYIKPDLNGHAPNPATRAEQAVYVNAGVPCLINGVLLYPKFEVHPGHTGRADWLYFKSLPDDANVGDVDAPAWASGTAYAVGDIVLAGSGANEIVSRCIQAHTSTTTGQTGDPDDENTGYETYWEITSAPTLEALLTTSSPLNTFAGVAEHISEVTSPTNGDWLYLVINEQVTAERYQPNGWYNFIPPNVHRLLPYAATEELAYPEIQYISSSQRTWAIIGTRLALLLAYTGPTPAQERFVWKRRDSIGRPELYDDDSSISGNGDEAIVTDIDVPSGHTWGFVNFGDVGRRSGAWHRFLVDDLTTRSDVSAGDTPSDANSLMFPINESITGYLMKTSAGKVATAINLGTAITTATAVRIRVD